MAYMRKLRQAEQVEARLVLLQTFRTRASGILEDEKAEVWTSQATESYEKCVHKMLEH